MAILLLPKLIDIIGNKLLGSRKEAKAIVIDEIASRIDFFSYFRLSLLLYPGVLCLSIARYKCQRTSNYCSNDQCNLG
jgi:hypothetical protein